MMMVGNFLTLDAIKTNEPILMIYASLIPLMIIIGGIYDFVERSKLKDLDGKSEELKK